MAKKRPRRGSGPSGTQTIYPIILAAGPRGKLPFPKALAPFGKKTALDMAIRTCHMSPGYARPIVVLGSEAGKILGRWKPPGGCQVVRNHHWRRGQLASLLAGLRRVPRRAPILIYPVDYPLLRPALLARLRRAYEERGPNQHIVIPVRGKRGGHPVILGPELRVELAVAATAREVIYRPGREQRVVRVPVRDRAIFRDFDSPSTYRLCVRLLNRRCRTRHPRAQA